MTDSCKTPTITPDSKTFTFTTPGNYSFIRLVVCNFNDDVLSNQRTTTYILSISYTGTLIV